MMHLEPRSMKVTMANGQESDSVKTQQAAQMGEAAAVGVHGYAKLVR